MNDSKINLWRLVSDRDEVHYFVADDRQDAVDQFCDVHGVDFAALWDIRPVDLATLARDMKLQPELVTIWCEDQIRSTWRKPAAAAPAKPHVAGGIIKYSLAAVVLIASWFCLVGFPGADGKLQGGWGIKGTVQAYCFINPEFERCK